LVVVSELFLGSACSAEVNEEVASGGIVLTRFAPLPSLSKRGAGALGLLVFLVAAFLKLSRQFLLLGRLLLLSAQRPDLILVQNPPSMPTLLLARLAAWRHGAALVIDWHNYGFSILACNARDTAQTSLVVRMAKWYELTVGSWADQHLTVTHAMKADLVRLGVASDEQFVHVLHDRAQRPPFKRLEAEEVHQLFSSSGDDELRVDNHGAAAGGGSASGDVPFQAQAVADWSIAAADDASRPITLAAGFTKEQVARHAACITAATSERTLCTFVDASGAVQRRVDRPALLMSGTSWSADEDFSILARAIKRLDDAIKESRGEGVAEHAADDGDDDKESAAASTGLSRRGGAGSSKKKKKALQQKPHKGNSRSSNSAGASSSSSSRRPLPRCVFFITGKGDAGEPRRLREQFISECASYNLRYCRVFTLFASVHNYRRLLGSCDLGVSLHVSSSGLDLPMKVVDMFGAELPVAAIHFPALGELVVEGHNGRVFGRRNEGADEQTKEGVTAAADVAPTATAAAPGSSSAPSDDDRRREPLAAELSALFTDLLSDFPPATEEDDGADASDDDTALSVLRRGAAEWGRVSWQSVWEAQMGPLLHEPGLQMMRTWGQGMLLKLLAAVLFATGVLLIVS
jgi:beta-1,4-mannosyltransferase